MAHGTHGITGAADTVMGLFRDRSDTRARLEVAGRDIEERSLALEADPNTRGWRLIGDTTEVQTTELQQAIFDVIARGEIISQFRSGSPSEE